MKVLGLAIACALALTACGKSENVKPAGLQRVQEFKAKKAAEKAEKEAAEKAAAEQAANEQKPAQNDEADSDEQVPTTNEPVVAPKPETAKTDAAAKADAGSKNAETCKLENDGADLVKLNSQLADAKKRYDSEMAEHKAAMAKNDKAAVKAALEKLNKTTKAGVNSCADVLIEHEKTAESCSSNKGVIAELKKAQAACDEYSARNGEIADQLAKLK